jgi:hypothetical protein
MWTFNQSSGELWQNGQFKGTGYAGMGVGKNNPAMQNVRFVGPIPCGFYAIGSPTDDTFVGKYALPLTPDPENEMFGRDSFFIHGDNPAHPGQSSDGCIVTELPMRMEIWESADLKLQVVAGA